MTAAPSAPSHRAGGPVADLLELASGACEAHHRPDLNARLAAARRRLADCAVRVVVVGEFKQGKSSLVNSLVGATVCPVDDDIATAVATYVRYGPAPGASLVTDGDPPRREPVPIEQVRGYVVEGGRSGGGDGGGGVGRGGAGGDGAPLRRVAGVEIQVPSDLLAGGIVVIDTPGVGGLASAHAAASLAALAQADAALFVTDASQELTRGELEFLRQAQTACGAVACVLTKIDFFPGWRTVRDLDEEHLRQRAGVALLPVSSALYARALRSGDAELYAESGFPELLRFLTDEVGGGTAARAAAEAAAEMVAVCDRLIRQVEAEQAALTDPTAARAAVDHRTAAAARLEALRGPTAPWRQALHAGAAGLAVEIDDDLRGRIRRVIAEADEAISGVDPVDAWPQLPAWLQSRLSQELLGNHALLRRRAGEFGEAVAADVRQASGEDSSGPCGESRPRVSGGDRSAAPAPRGGAGAPAFTMPGRLVEITLDPLGVGIPPALGHPGGSAEKERQVQQRRAEARNAVRRYCDQVTAAATQESARALHRIRDELAEECQAVAEELYRSNARALDAAAEAATRTPAERPARTQELRTELGALRELRRRAAEVAG